MLNVSWLDFEIFRTLRNFEICFALNYYYFAIVVIILL